VNSRWPLRLTVAISTAVAALVLVVALFKTRLDVPTVALGLLLLVGVLLRSKVGPVRAVLDHVVCIALLSLSGPASTVVVAVLLPLTQDRRLPLMRRVFNGAQAVLSGGWVEFGGVDGREGTMAQRVAQGPLIRPTGTFSHEGRRRMRMLPLCRAFLLPLWEKVPRWGG